MNKLVNLFFAITFSTFIFSCNAQTNHDLTAAEFESGISNKDSIQLLDVRTPVEFEKGHIKGALLADWNNKPEFSRRVEFIDKNRPVYIYCLGGGRSAAAARQLRAAGYEKVYELKGGINAWKAADKTLEGRAADEQQMSLEAFHTAINSGATVLVDFGAEWCPPCRKMEPVLKNLEANNSGQFKLVKVDGGRDQDILKAYNVTALPVFIVFKNGQQVWRKDGVAAEKEIAAQF